jgi:hypothetical protein
VIDDQIPRAGSRVTLTYRFLPTLAAGIEWNPRADDTSPLFNWLALEETERLPAVIVGASSDRIGTPEGEAYYVTASKSLKRETGLPIAPYLGAAYGTYEDRWRMIGGLSVGFREWCGALIVHDGVNLHPMLLFSYRRHTFSILWVDTEDLGVAWSVAF